MFCLRVSAERVEGLDSLGEHGAASLCAGNELGECTQQDLCHMWTWLRVNL